MMTSGIDVFQGVETPNENSTTTNDQCGQAITFPFFMKLLSFIPDNPPIIPPGNGNGEAYNYNGYTWLHAWVYRRAYDALPNSPENQINFNDITQENWGGSYSGRLGNDYDNGYILLPMQDAKNQIY
eukprot:322723_1